MIASLINTGWRCPVNMAGHEIGHQIDDYKQWIALFDQFAWCLHSIM
jgi:hypothetical protein